jgi:hypothetical protein
VTKYITELVAVQSWVGLGSLSKLEQA